MEKPDYDFWDQQPEYNLGNAAALCCDIEPERWVRGTPQKVLTMEQRLLREVKYRDTSSTRSVTSYGGTTYQQTIRGEQFFKREDLRSWADETGQRQLMPFLFPEGREQSNTDDARMRSDTREALLYIIGLLAHVVVKQRGGNDLGTNDKPNQSGIATVLTQQAEELHASTAGLSDSQLNDRLKEAFQEVKNRQKDKTRITK